MGGFAAMLMNDVIAPELGLWRGRSTPVPLLMDAIPWLRSGAAGGVRLIGAGWHESGPLGGLAPTRRVTSG